MNPIKSQTTIILGNFASKQKPIYNYVMVLVIGLDVLFLMNFWSFLMKSSRYYLFEVLKFDFSPHCIIGRYENTYSKGDKEWNKNKEKYILLALDNDVEESIVFFRSRVKHSLSTILDFPQFHEHMNLNSDRAIF